MLNMVQGLTDYFEKTLFNGILQSLINSRSLLDVFLNGSVCEAHIK